MELTERTVTFGKYRNRTLDCLLKDRQYCEWLLTQDWFQKQYEYLYNRIKEYNPLKYFITKDKLNLNNMDNIMSIEDFFNNYEYFNLTSLEECKMPLQEYEKDCYCFYLKTIEELMNRIKKNIQNNEINVFDIKAPVSLMKKFEEECKMPREYFKDFLASTGLKNIPYIVEDIKKAGLLEYKGARSFIIAKDNSLKQEKYWENILKNLFNEDIGSQYKFCNCIFDFIHINKKILFECKLNLKSFNKEQHKKYRNTLGSFSLIYLISKDCIIVLKDKKIYTTEPNLYKETLLFEKKPNDFELEIKDYEIIKIENVEEYFQKI